MADPSRSPTPEELQKLRANGWLQGVPLLAPADPEEMEQGPGGLTHEKVIRGSQQDEQLERANRFMSPSASAYRGPIDAERTAQYQADQKLAQARGYRGDVDPEATATFNRLEQHAQQQEQKQQATAYAPPPVDETEEHRRARAAAFYADVMKNRGLPSQPQPTNPDGSPDYRGAIASWWGGR